MGLSSPYCLLRQMWSLKAGEHAPCAIFQACFGKRTREKSWNLTTFPSHWVRNTQSFKTDLHKSQFLLCKPENEKEIESVVTQGKPFCF